MSAMMLYLALWTLAPMQYRLAMQEARIASLESRLAAIEYHTSGVRTWRPGDIAARPVAAEQCRRTEP